MDKLKSGPIPDRVKDSGFVMPIASNSARGLLNKIVSNFPQYNTPKATDITLQIGGFESAIKGDFNPVSGKINIYNTSAAIPNVDADPDQFTQTAMHELMHARNSTSIGRGLDASYQEMVKAVGIAGVEKITSDAAKLDFDSSGDSTMDPSELTATLVPAMDQLMKDPNATGPGIDKVKQLKAQDPELVDSVYFATRYPEDRNYDLSINPVHSIIPTTPIQHILSAVFGQKNIPADNNTPKDVPDYY